MKRTVIKSIIPMDSDEIDELGAHNSLLDFLIWRLTCLFWQSRVSSSFTAFDLNFLAASPRLMQRKQCDCTEAV